MLKESVGRFARDVVLPKAREMDENEMMDKSIVEQLFEQGLMGVEVEEAYGGSGMSFGAVVVAIEELARIDPSVCALTLLEGGGVWKDQGTNFGGGNHYRYPYW